MRHIKRIAGFTVVVLMFFAAGIFFAGEGNAQNQTYKIGDRGPAGGWIFYDKGKASGGWRYLEAAPDDQASNAIWGCYDKAVPGAKGTAIGTGKKNTEAILKACSANGTAAKIASLYRGGDKSDWFLPSLEELKTMQKNLYSAGIGGFDRFTYWSSTEYQDPHGAMALTMNSGDGFGSHKGGVDGAMTFRVRAIRAF